MHSEHHRTDAQTQAELCTVTLHFLLSFSRPVLAIRRHRSADEHHRHMAEPGNTQHTAHTEHCRHYATQTPCTQAMQTLATRSHALRPRTNGVARPARRTALTSQAHKLRQVLERMCCYVAHSVASEGRYRDSASNTTLRRRLHQALDTTRCTALLNTLTHSIRPVTRSSPHSSARSPVGFHTPPPPLTRRTYGRMPSPHGIHMPSPYGFPLPSPATRSKTTLKGSV